MNNQIATNPLIVPFAPHLPGFRLVALFAFSQLPGALAAQTAERHYDHWIRSFQGLSVLERAPSADPDRDGIPNAGEAYHGLDPTCNSSSAPNAPSVGYDGGKLKFGFSAGAAILDENEITPRLYHATGLTKWQEAIPTLDPDGRYVLDLDPRRNPRQFFRLGYQHNPPVATIPEPTFSARAIEALGSFDPTPDGAWLSSGASNGKWRATRRLRWTNIRGGFGKVAANFLVEGDEVPVAIMLSGEAYVRPQDRRLFVRLLVDGEPMGPGDVVFANGRSPQIRAARAFEFTGLYDRGLHTVEAEWRVDEDGAAFFRDAALLIRQGDTSDPGAQTRASLAGVTPDSGLNIETTATGWQDVPGLSATISTADRDCLSATVSAEAYAAAGECLRMRVLIDGAVADPGAVEFASDGIEGTHLMAFGHADPDPGGHSIQVQYRSDGGKSVGLGDRTLTVAVADSANTSPMRKLLRTGNNPANAPASYQTVPDMSVFTALPSDTDLSVIFTAEFVNPNPGLTWARLSVGGTPVPDSEVLLTNGDSRPGVHSFTFNAKHLNAGGNPSASTVAIEWKTPSGQTVGIGKRSMVLYLKAHTVPDLAEPPLLGRGYTVDGSPASFPVEPMHGKVHVLTILIEPKGIQDPVPINVSTPAGLTGNGEPMPTISDLEDALFGNASSAADYFDKISGGRFSIECAGVLGPYQTDSDWDFYYNGPGDHQDIWVEAVTKAAADGFPFSNYDFDGDRYISPFNELAVVIVKPQVSGGGYVRQLWSGESAKSRDGVYLDVITEWYTSDPVADYAAVIHELGHQVFNLADLYSKVSGISVGTRPGVYGLMDQGGTKVAQHPNPAYKIALGWTTPWIITQNDHLELEDIKVSCEAVVLPRRPSVTADEYLVVENRPQPANNFRYDFGIPDSGLAVWHLIESPLDSVNPPPCTAANLWNKQTGSETPRAGIRLVRPAVTYADTNSLWDSSQYDLDEFGLACPPLPPHNILTWSDGSSSYELRNFSAAGPVADFDVVAP